MRGLAAVLVAFALAGAAATDARASALAGAQFFAGQPTEARMTFRASAPGTDWGRRRHEAAGGGALRAGHHLQQQPVRAQRPSLSPDGMTM